MYIFFLIIRQPPRSTRTDTLVPYTTLFRSDYLACRAGRFGGFRRVGALRSLRGALPVGVPSTSPDSHAFKIECISNRLSCAFFSSAAPMSGVRRRPCGSRSAGRRGGKECVSKGRSRWSPYNEKKQTIKTKSKQK